MKNKQFSEFTWRLLAFICDFLLAYIIYFYLISFELFKEALRWIAELLNAQILSAYVPFGLLGWISSMLFIYLLCTAIRFYSTLVFGVSLMQFIFGLRPSGQALWCRVGGAARVALEPILTPFIVFDLPVIHGKSSFKEQITLTKVKWSKKSSSKYLSFSILLSVLVLSVIAPMFENLTLIDGVKVNFTDSPAAKIKSGSNFSLYQQYKSERYKMESFSSLGEGVQKIIPSFELVKVGKKTKITPYFNVYDVKRKSLGSYNILGRISLLKLIKLASTANPFFSSHYPKLSEIMENERSYRKLEYAKEYDDKKLLSLEATKEIKELIQTSFELSFSNLFSIVLDKGPFLRGYVLLRNRLIGKVDVGSIPVVDFINLGNYEFLRLTQNFSHFKAQNKGVVVTYIPIETLNSMVFQTSWGKEKNDLESKELFQKEFLSAAKWYFDYDNIFAEDDVINEIGPFQFLDFFLEKNLDKILLNKLEHFAYDYFFELGQRASSRELEDYRSALVASLKRIRYIATLKNKSKENYFSRGFLNNISNLTLAIEKNHRGYFDKSN